MTKNPSRTSSSMTPRSTILPPHRPRNRRQQKSRHPTLRFSPTAWAKLLVLRDEGPTEVGGFGITPTDDLLCVEDVVLVRQTCTAISVKFDDVAVAEFFEEQVSAGRRPEQFARIWIHTHPGDSALPSHVDEQTFRRVFGGCTWAVMFILANGRQSYARVRYGVGPAGEIEIPMRVEFGKPFAASDVTGWAREYADAVEVQDFIWTSSDTRAHPTPRATGGRDELSDDTLFDEYRLERRELESFEQI